MQLQPTASEANLWAQIFTVLALSTLFLKGFNNHQRAISQTLDAVTGDIHSRRKTEQIIREKIREREQLLRHINQDLLSPLETIEKQAFQLSHVQPPIKNNPIQSIQVNCRRLKQLVLESRQLGLLQAKAPKLLPQSIEAILLEALELCT